MNKEVKKQPGPHKNVQETSFTLKRAILGGTAGVAGASAALAAANKAFKSALKKSKKSPHKD